MPKQHTYVLGLNTYDHDVSACLLRDGAIAFAIAKERITREKHATGFYKEVIDYCLDAEGIRLDDVDLIELHDCFATAEIVHYENLGLCKDGEAGRMIDSGATQLGGRIPVNVSGGLLSKGHPLGATGIANIYEVTTHLRGEAGNRQVEGARIGLTHVVGAGSACAVHILEKAQ